MRFERCFDLWKVTLNSGGRQMRMLTFSDYYKIEEMVARGGGLRTLADRQAMESMFIHPPYTGIIKLHLTDEHFERLSNQ